MDLADKKIHFMGAGGIGVSALAFMACHAGAVVSCCDRSRSAMTDEMERQGVVFLEGHSPGHVAGIDLLVYSSAVPPDHPERLAASRQEMRGAFLARFLDAGEAWGVAGTHGKTTTTWLLARILIQAGLDPSVFIGGMVSELPGRNYRLGSGPFVSELDESDASFLIPKLDLAIITNIESEHLGHYGDDATLFAAFERFAAGVEPAGVLIAGVDSPVCRDVFQRHAGRKLSFAIGGNADLTALNVRGAARGSRFDAVYRGRTLDNLAVGLPGLHNVQNALAALGAALEMGVPEDTARDALATAQGVGRRMERVGEYHGAAVYSDYAHHPTEVAAAVAALRQMHSGKSLVVFQPHLYSRTRDYADAFGKALAGADAVLLVDVYAAREEPIPGVDSGLIAEAMRSHGASASGPVALDRIAEELAVLASGCEAVVMMGAGSIDAAARALAGGSR